MLALALGIAVQLQSITMQQCFWRGLASGMRVSGSTTLAIYHKMLQLGPEAFKQTTAGQATSIVSTDTQRLEQMFNFGLFLINGLAQFTATTILIAQLVGIAFIPGTLVMLILFPLQTYTARRGAKLRRKTVKHADDRVMSINETLLGIRAVKFGGWEPAMADRTAKHRQLEHKLIERAGLFQALISSTFFFAPGMAACATLLFSDKVLDQRVTVPEAFSVLAFNYLLARPLQMVPRAIKGLSEGIISIHRVAEFLSLPEIGNALNFRQSLTLDDTGANLAIVIDNLHADYGHAKSEEIKALDPGFRLSAVSLQVPRASMSMIIGIIGSGKSSLLSSLIGEMRVTEGQVRLCSTRIAYAPQNPWIFNATLRENIVFWHPWNEEWYNRVVSACALLDDIAILPAGDQTEIGERGVNLSGGQKARVSLARAVYSKAEVFLLDDPLSAVDTHVAEKLLNECIENLIVKEIGASVLLVTHQVQFAHRARHVVVLDAGRIKCQGSYQELVEAGVNFAKFDHATSPSPASTPLPASVSTRELPTKTPFVPSSVAGPRSRIPQDPSFQLSSMATTRSLVSAPSTLNGAEKKSGGKLTKEEVRQQGTVNTAVYKFYMECGGGWTMIALMCLYLSCTTAARTSSDFMLGRWVRRDTAHDEGFWLGLYISLILATVVSGILQGIQYSSFTIRAASEVQKRMMAAVLRAPMSYFDTTPTGQIINRFSRDQDVMDSLLPTSLLMFLRCFCIVGSAIVSIVIVFPAFLGVMAIFFFLFRYLTARFRKCSLSLKRLENVTRSPVFSQFSSTMQGLSSIRAYESTGLFEATFLRQYMDNHTSKYLFNAAGRWFALRLDCVTAMTVLCTAAFVVAWKGHIAASSAGVALIYSLQLTGLFQNGFRQVSENSTVLCFYCFVDIYSIVFGNAVCGNPELLHIR
jgi:ATP-binding cassette subfamily C (CFTR/MRP) protein 1